MSLAPRAVLVHRTTEYEELLARHGTHGQAAFFLSSRGRSIDEVARRHGQTRQALADVAAAVPLQWRQSRVERADLDRFLFGPEDVVVVVGQDGLVANAAKYLSGQPVVGIDTDPGRNPGVLVRHRPQDAAALLRAAASPAERRTSSPWSRRWPTTPSASSRSTRSTSARPAIRPPATGSARTPPAPPPDRRRPPASWSAPAPAPPAGSARCGRNAAADSPPGPHRPAPPLVRPGGLAVPATGTSLVAGELGSGQGLMLTVESDRVVVFGDGMESDALELTWGQTVRLAISATSLRLTV